MSTYSRPVLLLLTGLLLLTISIAVLNTLVPLWVSHAALPTWQVGLISSSYFIGNLVGILLAGLLIKRLGFTSSYYVACMLFALATAGLWLAHNFISWLALRFLAGIACALIWVIVESTLIRSGTLHTRVRLLATYMMVYYLGTVVGQLLLSNVATAVTSVLPWTVSLVVSAMLPLMFSTMTPPSAIVPLVALWPMLTCRSAKLGVNGCIISGIVLGSLYGLMPLYLSNMGLSDRSISYWMTLLVSTGVLSQWPIRCIADRYGRLLTLRVLVFIVIIGSVVMLCHTAMILALCLLGCSSFTLYPIAMSYACDMVSADELVAMNQALLLSYTLGSLFGPIMTSMLMQHCSDCLLFVMTAVVALVYLLVLLRKSDQHHTPPVATI